jgi:hypothetical protein
VLPSASPTTSSSSPPSVLPSETLFPPFLATPSVQPSFSLSSPPSYQFEAPASRLLPTSAPSVPLISIFRTSSPTATRVVPTITSVAVRSVTNDTVNLAVYLVYLSATGTGVDTGGSLYCVALKDGTPSSIGAIKSSVRDGSVYKGAVMPIPMTTRAIDPVTVAVALNMTVSGLEAVHPYRIYCYAETSGGEGNTLSEVLLTETSATTSCCLLVSFTNAPPYVFSDVARYNTSSRDLFVFSYSLPRAPTTPLIVSYTVTVQGAIRKDIVTVPSSSVFTSQSSLTGHFYLLSSIAESVACTVSLLFTGTQASNYANNGVKVMILSPDVLDPAPLMISCQFSDSSNSISVRFDSPTDTAPRNTVSWSCDQLFIFDGASLSSCVWIDSKTVRITFPVVDDVRSTVKQ